MNTFSKVLSMFLVVVMCFGLFATSAFAESFNFDNGNTGSIAAAGDSFNFQGDSNFAGAAQPESAPAADVNSFTLNVDEEAEAPAKQEAAEEPAVNTNPDGNFDFSMSDSATFDKPYEDMSDSEKADVEKFEAQVTTNKDGSIKMTGVQFDTFKSYKVAAGTDYNDSYTLPNEYLDRQTDSVTIKSNWVNGQAAGYYTVWGIKASDNTPIRIGTFQINQGSYDFTMIKDQYTKPSLYESVGTGGVVAEENTAGDLAMMERFGVASITGSYTRVLSASEYKITAGGTRVRLEESYLRGLADGEYYLIGFPSGSSTGNQVRMGKFVIRSEGEYGTGTWTLTPDYQIWYSGTDPLTFYSDVFAAAGEGWNYKGYGWDVIVPDIRVSTRADMTGATSVRIDQYWDLGYGYFMLGQNFLSSLSADETYYMQVIDARSPDLIRTNVVTFRVGPTLRAIDTDKHVINSTRSLRFRSSAPVAEVYVGNIMLTDPADYGVSWDGKTVTLSFEFLNKRSAGNTYTIKVRTTGGEWAATTFQVLTTAQGSASPRTGDESNLGLWAAFLLLSGTAVVVLVPKLRKQDF